VEREVAALTEKITALRARWTKEREAISRISELKKKIEALRFEAEEQTRKGSSTAPRRFSMANCPSWKRS
jgi:ATP-dependent Clp protease ATP-binding subunit ClpB